MKHSYKISLAFIMTIIFWSCMTSPSIEENNSSVIKQSEITETEREKREDEYIYFQGTVEKVTKLGGTLSEFSYYIIRINRQEMILFNENKVSEGFESFTGTEVTIKGQKTEGSIGWRKQKAMGLQVMEIKPVL